ncbi:biorientation of chromosomes in cell division protein 1-like 1 [Diachasma alloeum]|uniref:biorientation of chromosomes in cell division protein 1-like 1 n=1 Tax=Diachasma alloeum TaxID=454923 RepID=UPI0007384B5E|nr:biorientation of chromosomes in cell division protein 1-like 1 [Diachasma alloeum]
MNLGLGSTLLPGDPRLIDHIVGEVKSQGIFDQFRKECIADVDTKPAYQNLRTRVESSVNSFLYKQRWRADLNKNQLRETLRKHISDGPYLDTGVERIVDQVVNPKIYSVFMPQVEDVVHEFLGLEKPKREKNGACGFKDLLPKDLDPVSPESDKNSLKDISLDSVDANLTVPGEEEGPSMKREPEESEVKIEVKTEDISHLENDFSNGRMEEDAERSLGEPMDLEGNTPPPPGLNDSAQSEEKEEEEEDSPVFEPIDIMNLNESNISNDSHLSGISELTSHRSRSPDFSNDFSRDNFDFSNQDSQLSKVSSDSRLSIVTDFGSSNQPTTPVPDLPKDDSSKDKFSKDNFKEIRGEGDDPKDNKVDGNKHKENLLEMKDGSDTRSSKTNLSSKESSRDGMESVKEKSEHKSKEKIRESGKSKSSKARSESRESRSHRDREKDKKKFSHSESKPESSDKPRSRDKSENSRDSAEKLKETRESKDAKESKDTPTKLKEEKPKESPSKEGKDLKDIYKEKIRELREKKELTEKEKLNNEKKESKESSKDAKPSRDSKEKRDSPRDKEKHRSSSSRTHSSSRHESRSSKSSRDDSKSSKNDRDKTKRDDSHRSKNGKSKAESESNDKSDKSESKKSSKPDKDEKSEGRQDSKSTQKSTKRDSKSDSKSSERSEKREDKEGKDKRRKDEKKSKSKDDHSSLRKGSNDRRSSDRDGSSGSSGRGSQKSSSSPSTSSSKPSSSSLGKDSSTNSNSSSETSDGIDETQTEEFKPSDPEVPEITESKPEIEEKKPETDEPEGTIIPKRVDPGQSEISLPLKKRPLQSEDLSSQPNERPMKKPKFARNFAEAKKLMKIRKKIEKDHLKSQSSVDSTSPVSELSEVSEAEGEIQPPVPDEERVQIIEVKTDDEGEPYPGSNCDLKLDENSKVILTGDEILNTEIVAELKIKSRLSEMELSIRQSLTEMISDKTHEDNGKNVENVSTPEETPGPSQSEPSEADNSVEKIELKSDVRVEEEIESKEEQAKPENPGETVSRSSIKPPKGEQKEKEEQEQKPLDPPEMLPTPGTSSKNRELSDDEEDCRYFLVDNERLNRFTQFMNSLGLREDSPSLPILEKQPHPSVETPGPRTMAPPLPKRKYSTSPLSDILLNNSNNNNDGHKLEATIYQGEGQTATKKKKMGRPRKQRPSVNSPSPQMMNGENFVLPMSPESDASATSDKTPSSLKDERNRSRGSNQRYTSDDLYKPRPLFASSSRRSRRSNP